MLLCWQSSLFCSVLLFVMSFTLHFLGEPGSATSNGPEIIAVTEFQPQRVLSNPNPNG